MVKISRLTLDQKPKEELAKAKLSQSKASSRTTRHPFPTSIITFAKTDLRSTVSTFIPSSSLQCHCLESSMKVFNTYVQFCSLAYWGPSGGPSAPKMSSSSTTQRQEPTAGGSGTNQTSTLIQNLIQTSKQPKEKSRFQMTAFDILFNPLRAEHPFGKYPISSTHHFFFHLEDWSPREISKFQACMLMYGKNFGQYREHVSLIKFKILIN